MVEKIKNIIQITEVRIISLSRVLREYNCTEH